MLIVMIFLMSLLPAGSVAYAASTISFSGEELLGKPTNNSITINIVPVSTIEYYYEYGVASGVYTEQTPYEEATGGQPHEVVITGLDPDTQYFYRMRYHAPGGDMDDWVIRNEHSFWTQRAPGSTFKFTIVADSHAYYNTEYHNTMANVASDEPDFHFDLGDTFMTDGDTSQSQVFAEYLAQRGGNYMDLVGHSAPIFLTSGNHENEEGWNFDDTPFSIALASVQARKLYYPTPIPDSFYSGNSDPLTALDAGTYGDQYREDYYAWTWGDALFVVIDPYQYTMTNPYGATAGEGNDDPASGDCWNWTLGIEQYLWFKDVLENSNAKYKFVFSHHVVGGMPSYLYVRGGAEAVPYYEWGGKNWSGTPQFDTKRPIAEGWDLPIHELMVENGVSAYFHGHDHQYAYEVRDGIVYQCLPRPTTGMDFNYYHESDPYTIKVLPSPGHLRVTVNPEGEDKATVEYIGTSSGAVNYSYNILPSVVNQAPEVSDIPDQTIDEGETFATINLDDYVSDPDNTDAEMTWSYSGNTDLSVSIDGSRVATIGIPGAEWTGAEEITFRATDPGALWDENSATFTVSATPSVISGITAEVTGDLIPGATVKLYLDDVLKSTTSSDPDGEYELVVTVIGDYTVVASATGFKKEEQEISIASLGDDYTLDFIGNSGLVPQAPDMSYVLACANHWIDPPVAHPELALNMSKVLAVANAWLDH
jgi:hypothetical protein